MARKESVRILLPAAALAALLLLGPGAAVAGTPIKQGKYKGKTDQDAIGGSFRSIQLKVKKGKVTLVAEPTVGRQECVSTPVFTADGATPAKKLSRSRSFSFTRTFLGNKVDRIQGRFVGPDEIEGFATYHFFAQDLCSGGKMKVSFTAKHK
jgi:hypothetical protein